MFSTLLEPVIQYFFTVIRLNFHFKLRQARVAYKLNAKKLADPCCSDYNDARNYIDRAKKISNSPDVQILELLFDLKVILELLFNIKVMLFGA